MNRIPKEENDSSLVRALSCKSCSSCPKQLLLVAALPRWELPPFGMARRWTQIDADEEFSNRRARRKQRKTPFSLCAHVQTCLPYLRPSA